MDDVEYVLRIILKANDQMATVLSKARTQLRAFSTDANKMNSSVTNLNQALRNFDGNMENITKKMQDWRAALRDANSDGKDVAKTFDTVGKNAETSSKKVGQAARATEDLNKAANKLRSDYEKLNRQEEITDKNREYTIGKLKEIGTQLERLGKRVDDPKLGGFWFNWAKQAKDAAAQIQQTHKETEAVQKQTEEAHAKRLEKFQFQSKSVLGTQRELQKAARDARDEARLLTKEHEAGNIRTKFAIEGYEKLAKALDKISLNMTEASRKRAPAQLWVDEIEQASDRLKNADKNRIADAKARLAEERSILDDITSAVQDHVKRREDIEKNAGVDAQARLDDRARREKAAADAETARLVAHQAEQERIVKEGVDEIERLEKERDAKKNAILERRASQAAQRERLNRERDRLGDGGDPSEIRRLAAEYDKLGRSYRVGSARAKEFGTEAERLRTVIRSQSADTDRSATRFDRLSRALSKSHDSAAGFDNQMRGIGILAAVASIDQLISAAIALGGELVSLAGSAVMAGGALGGILAAGAAQALPVMGLLVGAVSRVKGVMDAFGSFQDLQKAQATDAEKAGQKSVDQTNALANAQDTAAAANDNLAESRKSLTQAQKDGVDQLEDLILAEKAAALAAKGAALNVKDAQEAMRLAVQSGASQLEIDQRRQALEEAKLGRTRANVGAKRATRDRAAAGGDVGNLESVQSAAKAVEDAEKAVVRANRGLDQASDKADRAASSTMTAAANLNYLLSQMSPAERKLFEATKRIYDSYKRIFVGSGKKDGIYGVIIDSFTRAVDEADKIMKMPKVIESVQGLADEIGANINKVIDAIDPDTIDQVLRIIDQAGENMGPLVDGGIKLAKAFLNISEAGNPAFQKLLEYLGGVVDKILEISEDDGLAQFFLTGEEHLESWLDLLGAIIGLFAALTGASAEEGKTSIDDLTKKIKGWTDWINDHKEEVVGFFEDARKAAYAIGGVLENVAGTLFKTFSAERVEKFADILNKVVVPALGDFIDLVGDITDAVAKFIDNPVGAQLAKWAIAAFLVTKLVSPIMGMFSGAALGFLKFAKGIDDAIKLFKTFGKHIDDLIKYLPVLRTLLMSVFTGPVAIVAAVVAAVVLLLWYFDKLDDIWNGIKETGATFLKDIQPALKTLQDALADAGIKVEDFGVVLDALKVIGGQIAEFISVYLIESFKALGKIVSGVVTAIIYTVAGAIRLIKGLVDVVVGVIKVIYGLFKGIFTGNWDVFEKGFEQILAGFENLVRGLITIIGGIVIGVAKALEGLVKAFLAPWKAAWAAVKKFFKISSPSKVSESLGDQIVEGLKEGLKGLYRALTWPWRKAWNAINAFFDGKPKKLAEKIVDELSDRITNLWRRIRNAFTTAWTNLTNNFNAATKFGTKLIGDIIDEIVKLPGKILDAVKAQVTEWANIGKSIGGFIVDGIKSVAGNVKDFFTGGDDDKKDGKKPAAGPQKPASTVSFDIGVGAIPFGAKDLKDAQNIYGEFWKELRRDARVSTDYIQKQFREMRIATTGSSEKMYDAIRGSLRDIQNSFKVRGGAATRNWEKTWLDFQKTAYEGLNYIGHQTNQALKGFGAKAVNFGLSVPTGGGKGGGGEAKAVGGWIGNQGERGRDMIHAVLGRGEAVLNWAHQPYVNAALQEKFGFGLDGLFGHTKALHSVPATNGRGFAEGGSTDTRLARLIAAANKVDAMHLPYVWGGGHQQPAQIGGGMDCSGSVSYVVQQAGYKVPTVTSGNMPSWGFKPGSDGATVFYNPEHTFMRIGQKYFGTTGFGHPGWTGAGWFTKQPSADYLSGFSSIHLPGITDVGGFATGVGGEIAKLIVKGSKGAAKTLMQKAFDLVVPGANKFIGEQSSQYDAGPGQPGDDPKYADGVLTAGQVGNYIREALGILDISKDVSMWVSTLTRQASRESSFNPNAINNWDINAQRGDPSIGLVQIIGSNFRRYMEPGHGNIRNPLDNLLAVIKYTIDRYGGGNATRAVSTLWGRGGGAYAEGGIVDGPDGAPTPILAHAGEWVLNKGQQLRAAMMTGMSRSGLRDALGFTGGPTSFAGGGEVRAKQLKAAGKVVTAVEVDLSDDLFQNVQQSLADLRGLMRAIPKIKKITNSVKPIIDLIELSTKEGGFLDQLRGSIEKQFATTALRLRKATYEVGAGREVKYRKGRDTEVERAGYALTAVRGQRDELTDERSAINAELAAVKERLKGNKVKGDARRKLIAQQVDLTNRSTEADERVQQNEEDIFAAQEALIAARKEAAQKRVDDVKKASSRLIAANDLLKRGAAALGDSDAIIKYAKAGSDLLTQQANDLEAQIAGLEAAGDKEGAIDLRAEVADLRMQVKELAQQALRDASDAIGAAAAKRGTVLDLFDRMANAMGVVGKGVANITGFGGVAGLGGKSRADVAQGRIDSAVEERKGYAGLLGQAQAAGNIGLVNELTDKINDLTVQIVENTKAARDAKFAASSEEFDYLTSINDLKTQLVTATDAVSGQTNSTELLRLANERKGILDARTIELDAEWKEALAEGDIKSARDLEKALLQNQIAVQQNTKSIDEMNGAGSAPASYTSTAWQWFRSAMLTGTGGVMPQYTAPTMQAYGDIGPGGTSSSSTINGGSTVNIEINEAGQPIDPTQLASTVVFAQSTAQ